MERDGRPLQLLVGYFDPLDAAAIRKLGEKCAPGHQVVVVLDDPPDSLLNRRARMELAASLACVSAVISEDPDSAVRLLGAQAVTDLRESDSERRSTLEQHVVARHRSA